MKNFTQFVNVLRGAAQNLREVANSAQVAADHLAALRQAQAEAADRLAGQADQIEASIRQGRCPCCGQPLCGEAPRIVTTMERGPVQ